MSKLIIRVGANPMKDMKDFWQNPSSKKGNYYSYINNLSELQSLLSSERLNLVNEVLNKSQNISELVKKTGRKQEAISRDASILESAGLITKCKKGRKTFLKTRVKKIEIDLG
jgi:predicted transcriptional regulator